jgi:hypothetical protein
LLRLRNELTTTWTCKIIQILRVEKVVDYFFIWDFLSPLLKLPRLALSNIPSNPFNILLDPYT